MEDLQFRLLLDLVNYSSLQEKLLLTRILVMLEALLHLKIHQYYGLELLLQKQKLVNFHQIVFGFFYVLNCRK